MLRDLWYSTVSIASGEGVGQAGGSISLREGRAFPDLPPGKGGNRVAPLPVSPRWGEAPGSLPRRGA